MGGFNSELAEILRRQQLQRTLFGNPFSPNLPETPSKAPSVELPEPPNPQIPAKTTFPEGTTPGGPISGGDKQVIVAAPPSTPSAMSAYQEYLQKEPLLQDYQPSLGRRVLGAIGKWAQSASGGQGGKYTAAAEYAPFQRKQAEFQQVLGQKRTLAELESEQIKAAHEGRLSEEKTKAEVARREAEQARAERQRKQAKAYQPETEEEAIRLAQAKIRPPSTTYTPPEVKTLKSGEKVMVSFDRTSGEYVNVSNHQRISPSAFEIEEKEPVTIQYAPGGSPTGITHRGKTYSIDDPEMPSNLKTHAVTAKAAHAAHLREEEERQRRGFEQQESMAGRREATAEEKLSMPTTATRTMGEVASTIVPHIETMRGTINKLRSKLGPASGRWNQLWTGTIGASDPDFAKLISETTLMTTAIVRMHMGARGGQMMIDHFKHLLDQGKQSPDNMLAALDTIEDYAKEYAAAGKGKSVEKSVEKTPSVGEVVDGYRYKGPDPSKRSSWVKVEERK